METYRIRYIQGTNRVRAIELAREFMGVGLRVAKEIIETRGVILDHVSAAEARRVAERFTAIGAVVEVERLWRHVYAYDPRDSARGDQLVSRLRAGELELAVDEGPLGRVGGGEAQRFEDESLTERRVLTQLEQWTRAGLRLADSEIAVLEALSEREPSLEAHLREQPDDEATHLIYGDWLQARGDPRGQLVMLQHACEQATDERALVELRAREQAFRHTHAGHLFGPVAEHVVVRWRLGFVDAAFVGARAGAEKARLHGLPRLGALRSHGDGARPPIGGGPLQMLADLLRLPIAARMTSLGLTRTLLRRPQLESILCASVVVAWLRELELGDGGSPGDADGDRPMPSLARLWPHLRKLRKLTIHGDQPPLRAIHSPTLEHLELHMHGLGADFPQRFVAGRLPRLRTLTLDLASAEHISPPAFADLLALPDLDGIRELIVRLPHHPIPQGLAEILASIPRLSALEIFDLSRCVADERAMAAIVSARDRGRLPDGLLLPRAR